HVVLHMFDITESISQVDKKIADVCVENSKPVLLVGNKLDLAGEGMPIEEWDAYVRQQLTGIAFAPLSFISALDDENVTATLGVLFDLRAQARTQIPTARLNEELQAAKQQLRPRSKSVLPKLFYGTQIGTEPLSILIFVNE